MLNRRQMLQSLSCGFGFLALRNIAHAASVSPMAPKSPMFPARAKRVIFMYMQGAPSQFETFDYNPGLAEASKSKNLMAPAIAVHKTRHRKIIEVAQWEPPSFRSSS